MFAQSVAVSDVDASQFPVMQGKLLVFDNRGNQVTPAASDVSINDDGVIRSVTSISCPPPSGSAPVSLTMSVDISSSMAKAVGGVMPIDMAKTTTTYLANALTMPPAEMALQSCNDVPLLLQDFTTDRARILNQLPPIIANGNNNFAEHLLNPLTGLLNLAKKGRYRRVAVLYTDAWWYAMLPQEIQRCKDTCIKNGVRLFVILYSRPEAEPNGIKESLKEIAEATGGRTFDGVTSQQAAQTIADTILKYAVSSAPCTVTWQSGPSCRAGLRPVLLSVASVGASAAFSYPTPLNAVASLTYNPAAVYCANKVIGVKFDTTITITARNAALNVSAITSSNPAFDVNPKSFSVASGGSKSVTVSFTPPDSGYQWTRFSMTTDLCPQTFTVSGGYVGKKPVKPSLHLDAPNGGEVFVSGSDTVITWSGMADGDAVALDYSTDRGATWLSASSQETKGRGPWRVPSTPSTQCLARVRQLSEESAGWVSGVSDGSGMSTASDSKGNTFVTGWFQNVADFGGVPLTSAGDSDIFIAKYSVDGTLLWAKRAGGPGPDIGNSVAVDSADNVYLTGFFTHNADFSGTHLASTGVSEVFVAKYLSDGTLAWAIAPTEGKGGGGAGNGIAVDAGGNAYVTGWFVGSLSFGATPIITVSGYTDIFTVKLLTTGTSSWVRGDGSDGKDGGRAIALDGVGGVYVTGWFSDTAFFQQLEIVSLGKKDAFLIKRLTTGAPVWIRGGGGTGDDEGVAVATDLYGNAFMAVQDASGLIKFNSTVINGTGNGVTIAKYNPTSFVLWAKRGATTEYDQGAGLAADPLGRVTLACNFFDNITFADFTVVHRGAGMFVGTFDSVGHLYLGRTASAAFAGCIGLGADGRGNLLATGWCVGPATIGGLTLRQQFPGGAFAWKIEAGELQSDVSDAVWSIVAPHSTAHDVDCGTVFVGASKDTLVDPFAENTGTFALRIDSIYVAGGDASQFHLASGIAPYALDAKSSHTAEFRFSPTSAGAKSATIIVLTQGDTLLQAIRGEGVLPVVQVLDSIIDFGPVKEGLYRDSLNAITIRNASLAPVRITQFSIASPDDSDFSILNNAGVTLGTGDTARINLRYTPTQLGRTEGRLLLTFNGVGSPVTVLLFGTGLPTGPRIEAAALVMPTLNCGAEMIDTVRVLNTGSEALQLFSAVFSGTDASAFSFVTPFSPATIPVDSILAIAIKFSPAATGPRSATLTLHSNAAKDSVLNVPLSGEEEIAAYTCDLSDIDFGVQCPGDAVDTVIAVKNTGTSGNALFLRSSLIVPAQPRLTLNAGVGASIPLHWLMPATTGLIGDTVIINDSLCGIVHRVAVHADVEQPIVSTRDVALATIFGDTVEGEVPLINSGERAAVFSALPQIDPFVFVNPPGLPFAIAPHDSLVLRIRYVIQDSIPHAVDALFAASPCSTSCTSHLSGIVGLALAEISVGNVQGAPGDTVHVAITQLRSLDIQKSSAQSYSLRLHFNTTLLEPLNISAGTINGGDHFVTLQCPSSLANNALLGTFAFRVGLGTDSMTALHVDLASADVPTVAFKVHDGAFQLTGTCHANGLRLLNPEGHVALSALRPNPVGMDAAVDLETIEIGRTQLYVIDVIGREVVRVFDGDMTPGKRTLQFSTALLSPGMYRLILQTPSVREVLSLGVSR